MVDVELIDRVRDGLLERQGKTWDVDDQTKRNARDMALAAISTIRKHAGEFALDILAQPDVLDLTVTCAWYLAENRRAEFLQDYGPELLMLRLQEGFGCGKGEEADV